MKALRLVSLGLALAIICVAFSGCSLAAWARLFNHSDHEILVRDSEGKKIAIAPGGSAPMPIWAMAKAGNRGFVIIEGDRELFYAVRPDTKADREDARFTSPILPSVSARTTMHGIEYQLAYRGAGEIFALVAKAENPQPAYPQPPGFPIRPNQ